MSQKILIWWKKYTKIYKKKTSWIDLYGETPKAYMAMAEGAESYEERIKLSEG